MRTFRVVSSVPVDVYAEPREGQVSSILGLLTVKAVGLDATGQPYGVARTKAGRQVIVACCSKLFFGLAS
jgi:hypothetical protein